MSDGTPAPESGLPQAIPPYVEGARKMNLEQFCGYAPWPFLLFPQSKLWDPLLLQTQDAGGGATRVVSYNVEAGGRAFIMPIKKRRPDGDQQRIIVGRTTAENDLVVPVSSVSSTHAAFIPPDPAMGRHLWNVMDIGSSNGTWVGEERLEKDVGHTVADEQYLRFGGNLIAWFFGNVSMFKVLCDDEALQYYVTS